MSGKLFAPPVMKAICAWAVFSLPAAPSHARQAPAMEVMVPLPDPNPLRSPAQTPDQPIAPPHPRKVETPEWSDEEISMAVNQCGMMLAGTGAVYKLLDPIREGRCGTPAPIELSAIGNVVSVKIHPPVRVTCGLAASLSAWMDGFVQPAAKKLLDVQVTRIRNVASYVCRNRYGSAEKPLSEHARANALDMAAFQTESGAWITVLDHWARPPQELVAQEEQESGVMLTEVTQASETPKNEGDAKSEETAEPSAEEVERIEFSSEAAFLNEIHAGGCTLFGTVLGPRVNEAHKNHFHYDLAERKHSAYCE